MSVYLSSQGNLTISRTIFDGREIIETSRRTSFAGRTEGNFQI